MWESVAQALCLLLIIEGIIPFLYPKKWRKLAVTLAGISDAQLRFIGLISMVVGLLCLGFVTK